MLSAISFHLDQSKILSSGNGLNLVKAKTLTSCQVLVNIFKLTVLELNMPVVPPKSPGSMMTTLTPNFIISSRKTSENASTAYLVAP